MALTPEERRARRREYRLGYFAKYPEKKREWYLKNRARILGKAQADYVSRPDEWKSKRELKAGRPRPDQCEICGASNIEIVWDHCHRRGIFRGWICYRCNTALGCVQDDPNHLRKLIAYLERTKKTVPSQLALSGM